LNLYDHLKNNNFRGFPFSFIRKIVIQLLQALVFLRQHHIIHCDLKPENILLKSLDESEVKLIDFGSSCFEEERIYTYIQSRFYRAPEVMLGISYTSAIDIWSLGCIAVELWTGFPIFPGEYEGDQFNMIMEVCGVPPKEIIEAGCRSHTFFDHNLLPILVPNTKGRLRFPGTKSLQSKLRTNDEKFVDFIRRCLEWDPRKRMTPQEALKHPWITDGTLQYLLFHNQKTTNNKESIKRKDKSLEQRQQEVIKRVDKLYQQLFRERNSLAPKQEKNLTPCRADASLKNLKTEQQINTSKIKKTESKICLKELSQKLNITRDLSTKKSHKRILEFNGNATCNQITGISRLIDQGKQWKIMEPRKDIELRSKVPNINVNPITSQVPSAVPSKNFGKRKFSNAVQKSLFIKLGKKLLRKNVNTTTVESSPKKLRHSNNIN